MFYIYFKISDSGLWTQEHWEQVSRCLRDLLAHSAEAHQILQELQHSNHFPQGHLKQEIAAQWTSLYLLYVKVTLKQQKVELHPTGRENRTILSSFQWSQMSDGCKILGLQVEASGELHFLVTCCHQSRPSGFAEHVEGLSNQRCHCRSWTARWVKYLRLETDFLQSGALRSECFVLATLIDPCFKGCFEEFLLHLDVSS